MPITIKDVAKKAGVSISTASRALNDSNVISALTKEKVKKAAQALNYSPNYNARNLSLGETNIVGVVSPIFSGDSSSNLFQMDLIHAISQTLNKKDYELVLITGKTQKELLAHILKNYEQFKINNFIFLKDEISNTTLTTLQRYQINFVVIGHSQGKVRYVNNDNVLAGEAATKFLVEKKKSQQPIFFQSSKNLYFEQDRYLGYEKYLKKLGKSPVKLTEKDDLELFIRTHPSVDGIVCVDDSLMIKELNSIVRISLPVIIFNDSYLVSKLLKKWTLVDLKPELLGQAAVEVLFNSKVEKRVIDFEIKDYT